MQEKSRVAAAAYTAGAIAVLVGDAGRSLCCCAKVAVAGVEAVGPKVLDERRLGLRRTRSGRGRSRPLLCASRDCGG